MKESLSEEVEDIKPSVRLTDSAAVLILAEHDMGPQMRQIMEAAGQAMPVVKPILEVNTDHGLLKRLESEKDESRSGSWLGWSLITRNSELRKA